MPYCLTPLTLIPTEIWHADEISCKKKLLKKQKNGKARMREGVAHRNRLLRLGEE
jgi:hypothetical protein